MTKGPGISVAARAADRGVGRIIGMTTAFEITAAEVGFLTARPTDPTSVAKEFRWVHVPGLPVEQVQFWRVGVRSPTQLGREHLMIMAHYPPLPPATCDAIAALVTPLHPQAILSFTLQDGSGMANIRAASHAAEVAGVVAEVKRRGGWDESPQFRIVVGDRPFLVTLQWTGRTSTAAVMEQAGQ